METHSGRIHRRLWGTGEGYRREGTRRCIWTKITALEGGFPINRADWEGNSRMRALEMDLSNLLMLAIIEGVMRMKISQQLRVV